MRQTEVSASELIGKTFEKRLDVTLESLSIGRKKRQLTIFTLLHMDKLRAFFSKSKRKEKPSNNGLTFEYFQEQFLLECLLKIPWTNADETELFELCLSQLADNRAEVRVLVEFKESYAADRALSWYLRECFLYKILNNCLESSDIRNLVLFRRVLRDAQHERVLIEIDADPRVGGSRPFVQLHSLSFAEDKNEVLFAFGSIFLLNNIQCGNDGIYRIELTLYTDADHELNPMFDELRATHLRPNFDLLDFAQVLTNFDRLNEAESYVQNQLEKLSKEHPDVSRCYRILGSIALADNQFETSLVWLQQALEFDLDKSSAKLADDHELIGQVYLKKGSIEQALSHCSAALEIRQSSLPPDDESIGRTYEQLARLYHSKGDLSGARSCLQRAQRIYQRIPTFSPQKLDELDEQIRRYSK